MSAASRALDVLRRHLSDGDLTTLLCDRGAALPVPGSWSVRLGSPVFAGTVRTVRSPSGTLAPIRALLDVVEAGSVVLIDAEAFDGAVWGGRLAARARASQVVGVIVVGRVRDVDVLASESLGTVAIGVAPHRSEASDPGAFDVPLRLGSSRVHPGDIVLTDRNGVVAIPAARSELVASELERWLDEERAADAEAYA